MLKIARYISLNGPELGKLIIFLRNNKKLAERDTVDEKRNGMVFIGKGIVYEKN